MSATPSAFVSRAAPQRMEKGREDPDPGQDTVARSPTARAHVHTYLSRSRSAVSRGLTPSPPPAAHLSPQPSPRTEAEGKPRRHRVLTNPPLAPRAATRPSRPPYPHQRRRGLRSSRALWCRRLRARDPGRSSLCCLFCTSIRTACTDCFVHANVGAFDCRPITVLLIHPHLN